MKRFELDLGTQSQAPRQLVNSAVYTYDFQSFSVLNLQAFATTALNEDIKQCVFTAIPQVMLIEKLATQGNSNPEYVAKLTAYAQAKIAAGEWQLGMKRESGELLAHVRDVASGRIQSQLTLEPKVVEAVGSLPEFAAIQGQLAAISAQIESLSQKIVRVERGQYNDRYAGFFSARQQLIEGLSVASEQLRTELLLNAIKINNDTIAKVMFAIHHDATALLDKSLKSKEAKRIYELFAESMGYLNASVQLNVTAYTALAEEAGVCVVLQNYRAFLEQTLLRENDEGRCVAWLLDNGYQGTDSAILTQTTKLATEIQQVTSRMLIGRGHHERIEAKNL